VERKTLNLGILAHVDAGKTTLTERLLYAAGVIDELGSVDRGTTQTDTLALERQRGITIRSAVVSFAIGDVTVNLIDTPGHPDFIAEVERVLAVLDGAVLVLSAVEGVQPQTRILMRALQRLRIPTLLFVNKIDRAGADDERVLRAISERLTPAIVPMVSARGLGTRAAEVVAAPAGHLTEALAERSDAILAAYVDGAGVPEPLLREELARQTKSVLVHPVYVGSSLTGAGLEPLTAGIAELLPAAAGDPDGPVRGTVFKIDRGPAGEKIAYVRMFSGTLRTRDRVPFGEGLEGKVTAVRVFDQGPAVQRPAVSAGEIGTIQGLAEIRIGDRIGLAGTDATAHEFPPPTLESVVEARNPDDRGRLGAALARLAEEDPLIDVRQNAGAELSVSLYGEVQKEVLEATLADDFGVPVSFRESTTICIERPAGSGRALETLQSAENPFMATVGLRVEPGPIGSGVEFRLDFDRNLVPLHIYKTHEDFAAAMARYVRDALSEGLSGWQVTDCVVTMDDCGHYVGDGPGKRPGGEIRLHSGVTAPADFRRLTPVVLMRALEQAGTVVCEPVAHARVEVPTEMLGAVLPALVRLGAAVETTSQAGTLSVVEATVAAAKLQELRLRLPGLSGGEGVIESEFGGYRPVEGEAPSRQRTTANPLNLAEYVSELSHRRHGSLHT
jgi:ribosomal protection tetracycline resistance protein